MLRTTLLSTAMAALFMTTSAAAQEVKPKNLTEGNLFSNPGFTGDPCFDKWEPKVQTDKGVICKYPGSVWLNHNNKAGDPAVAQTVSGLDTSKEYVLEASWRPGATAKTYVKSSTPVPIFAVKLGDERILFSANAGDTEFKTVSHTFTPSRETMNFEFQGEADQHDGDVALEWVSLRLVETQTSEFNIDFDACGVAKGGSKKVFGKDRLTINSHGDPHFLTADGIAYDLQAGGEFILVQSEDSKIRIHSRQEKHEYQPSVASNSAVALQVGADTLEFYVKGGRKFYLNGKTFELPKKAMDLPGGGRIERSGQSPNDKLLISWPNDVFFAQVNLYPGFLDIGAIPNTADQKYVGLFGNYDGNSNNDMIVRGTKVLCGPVNVKKLNLFANSWRLTAQDSLFTSQKENSLQVKENFASLKKDTATKDVNVTVDEKLEVKKLKVSLKDIDIKVRAAAQRTCEEAGTTSPVLLQGCIVDFVQTGNKNYVKSTSEVERTSEIIDLTKIVIGVESTQDDPYIDLLPKKVVEELAPPVLPETAHLLAYSIYDEVASCSGIDKIVQSQGPEFIFEYLPGGLVALKVASSSLEWQYLIGKDNSTVFSDKLSEAGKFIVTKALAPETDESFISLQVASGEFKGQYLRHQGFQLKLDSISTEAGAQIQPLRDASFKMITASDGYFKLTTQFRENKNECLEGNQVNGSKNGAAFMDKCQNVSGQVWKMIPEGNGYFKLTTQFREKKNECLEGNQVNGSRNGAAFMDKCQNVSGQLWKKIPAGGGFFKLTTQFREGKNECLEGNQVNGSRNGAAFMDKCQNVSGQLWKIKK